MTDIGATEFADYVFPQWADTMGWLMGASTLAPFVVFAIRRMIIEPRVNICKQIDRFQENLSTK